MKQPETPAGTDTGRPDTAAPNPAQPAPRRRPPGLREARRLLRTGELTPRRLLESCLDRLPTAQAAGAFVLADPDGARAVADRIDPDRDGPLAGIPVAVKDLVDVAGWPTRAGRRDGPVAPADAPVVAALRAAGAVIVGKTRTDEIGLGTFTPGAHDPRDPARSVGGSSGGSALAVALGAVLLALATDTAGSARIPAAATGVAGLCRARGAWPAGGVVGLSPRFDRLGLIAADTGDLALACGLLAPGHARPRLDEVHVLEPEALGRIEPQRADAARAAADLLARHAGRPISHLPGPALHEFGADRAVVVTADAARAHPVSAAETELVRAQLSAGSRYDDAQVDAAWSRLRARGAQLTAAIGDGVLVLPTLPDPPPPWSELGDLDGLLRALGRLTRLCAPVNSAELAAASLPWSADDAGRPIGVQLVAASEPVLFAAISALAPNRGPAHDPRPGPG